MHGQMLLSGSMTGSVRRNHSRPIFHTRHEGLENTQALFVMLGKACPIAFPAFQETPQDYSLVNSHDIWLASQYYPAELLIVFILSRIPKIRVFRHQAHSFRLYKPLYFYVH